MERGIIIFFQCGGVRFSVNFVPLKVQNTER